MTLVERRNVLITVKTYPQPSHKYGETVCVAGVDIDTHMWLRLYPVPFRDLPAYSQFKKYTVVSVAVEKHRRDPRPESYRPDWDSFEPQRWLPTKDRWRHRLEMLAPALAPSMCAIQQRCDCDRTSLGGFRPAEVTDFMVSDDVPNWSGRQRAAAMQLQLFAADTPPLEKVPLKFAYRYRCTAEGCRGHRQSLLEWEAFQLYRNLKASGDPLDAIKAKIRQKYLDDLCGPERDPHFFVGTHSSYPKTFMIVGVSSPPKQHPTLF